MYKIIRNLITFQLIRLPTEQLSNKKEQEIHKVIWKNESRYREIDFPSIEDYISVLMLNQL